MTDALCPSCGCEPTHDSIVYERLSHLGYHHTDTKYECRECGDRWQVGEPHGTTNDDTWICDCCGGDFIPHFVYIVDSFNEESTVQSTSADEVDDIDVDDEQVRCRPKCRDCHYVPDEPIEQSVSSNGTTIRWFVGHHSVTGSRDDATPNSF